MGTGKSSVGRLVADTLHFTFLDTDDVIEARAGIYDSAKSSRQPRRAGLSAIGNGGSSRNWPGALKPSSPPVAVLPANEANLASLKSHSLVVCLWASPEKIYQRVKSQTHRPLLHDPDPQAKIRELLTAREPILSQGRCAGEYRLPFGARSRAAGAPSISHGATGPSMKDEGRHSGKGAGIGV